MKRTEEGLRGKTQSEAKWTLQRLGAMSKDLYIEISAHFGIESVENLIADRRNRFINRYGETDNQLFVSNVTLTGSICLTVFFIYCVCLFPFAKFFSFFHLYSATTYVGEIKLYI